VTSEKFKWLIRSIFAVQDKEMLCSKFFDVLPRYVDLQLEGKDADKVFPEVRHHLHQCPECNEVYQALLQAVQSEKEPDKK
jgi:predicted anti-sigma-YlaC factor YlaD